VHASSAYLVFVALEHVSGASLAEAMQRPLAVGVSLNCLAQACIALDALHQAGLVHGDLKLEHFSFRADGALVLTDFNVPRRVAAALGLQEQAPACPLSPRTDFLALGRILHALLTGDRLFLGPEFAAANPAELERRSRLAVQLSPIQPCLDALLGVDGQTAVDQAQDVLIALMGVRDIFPFDKRVPAVGRSPGSRLSK